MRTACSNQWRESDKLASDRRWRAPVSATDRCAHGARPGQRRRQPPSAASSRRTTTRRIHPANRTPPHSPTVHIINRVRGRAFHPLDHLRHRYLRRNRNRYVNMIRHHPHRMRHHIQILERQLQRPPNHRLLPLPDQCLPPLRPPHHVIIQPPIGHRSPPTTYRRPQSAACHGSPNMFGPSWPSNAARRRANPVVGPPRTSDAALD